MRRESSSHKRTNQLLIVFVVLTNVFGNVALSNGMHEAGSVALSSPFDYLLVLRNPWVVGGILALTAWMLGDLALLSRADLSFVLPVTASGYVLIAIAGYFWLGDKISLYRWIGIIIISFGVALAEETPSRTTSPGEESR